MPDQNEIKINFIPAEPDPSHKRFFFFLKLFVALALSATVLGLLAFTNHADEGFLAELTNLPIVKQVRRLIHSADRSLAGQDQDRINILLMGMGGVGHDGPYLTDTIILASIQPSTRRVALISIPRDLAVPIPGYGWYKLNHANAFGEEKNPGNGGELPRTVLSDVLDTPIPYYVRVDFDGFTKLLDDLGGIDVNVDRGFTDAQYPIDEAGNITTIGFDAGPQHMDGARALEFARSRHGGNGEGSDFARARRQQKILLAVKDKVFSLGTLRSPAKISAVLDALASHIHMNLSPWELVGFAQLASSLDTSSLITDVLDDSPKGLLTDTTGTDNAFLLVPRDNNWDPVRTFVRDIFSSNAKSLAAPAEPVRVEIENGTFLPGLAARAAELLRGEGFTITKTGNAPTRDHAHTIIYDLTHGTKPEALATLKHVLHSESAGTPMSAAAPAEAAITASADFIVILGTDQP